MLCCQCSDSSSNLIAEKRVSNSRAIRFEAIFADLEKSIEMLDRNVHPTLILVVLLGRLNLNLILKGSSI